MNSQKFTVGPTREGKAVLFFNDLPIGVLEVELTPVYRGAGSTPLNFVCRGAEYKARGTSLLGDSIFTSVASGSRRTSEVQSLLTAPQLSRLDFDEVRRAAVEITAGSWWEGRKMPTAYGQRAKRVTAKQVRDVKDARRQALQNIDES